MSARQQMSKVQAQQLKNARTEVRGALSEESAATSAQTYVRLSR